MRYLLAAALVLAYSPLAFAAPPAAEERALTQGVDRPIHDYSAEGDASSIELNPALLIAAPVIDVALLGYQAVSSFARGSGFGAFIAANLRFGFAVGFGAQFIQPQLGKGVADFALDRNQTATKLSWAFAGGLGKNVSGVPLGANVLFEKDRGIAVPWDDSLRILEVRYVLAIVDIIGQDEIQ